MIVFAPLRVIAGSTVTLTCTVKLSPAVDVPVTVNTEWTGPYYYYVPVSPVPAVMLNIITYISTVSVRVATTGNYVCQASIVSGGTTSGSINITVGV